MEKEIDENIHSTMPLGMIIVRDDYLITVSLKEVQLIKELEKAKSKKNIITYKKSRMILQAFYKNAEMYLTELRKIDREKEKTEMELNNSMKNKELLTSAYSYSESTNQLLMYTYIVYVGFEKYLISEIKPLNQHHRKTNKD